MKILYYSPNPQLSMHAHTGPGTHIREVIMAMRHLGHEVLPVIIGDLNKTNKNNTVINKGNLFKNFLKKIIPGIIWRSLKEFQLLKADRIAESILLESVNHFKPDLIYERGAYLQVSGINVSKKRNILHIIEMNAPFIDEVYSFERASTLWIKKARQIERLQIQYPSKVYVVSSALKEYYSRYVTFTEKIIVAPNSVNIKNLKISQELKKQIILRYSLQGKTIIGFVGSMFPYHGVDILIKAFSEINRNRKDTVLLIVGDGAILPDLMQFALQLKVEKHIVFTGAIPHSDVFSYIDLMDITVMAKSNWYGSPVKIFEYGAMKKAIVAPDIAPIRDVMENEKDGLLVNPDHSELATAIERLINDMGLRKKMALEFHEKIIENYTWDKFVQGLIGSISQSGSIKIK
jgi:glycosyltransferase involved in cell wall biosynthesis